MKHIINAALIVLAVIFFSGCEFRDGLGEPRFTESTSFVQGYYCPTDNKMEALPQSYGTISVGCGEGGKMYKYF